MQIQIRELKHVTTVSFETTEADTGLLLRLLADYLDASQGTLQNVTYHNEMDEDGYREWIIAHVECPWSAFLAESA